MIDVCFILNDDSKDWPDYITSLFKRKIKVHSEFDSKLVKSSARNTKPLAKSTVIVVSHGHINFLRENVDFSYKSLVPDPTDAVLFMLGVKMEDLTSVGSDRQPITTRFPNFSKWKQFDHEHTSEMVAHLEKPRRVKPPPTIPVAKNFRLVPDTARSEDPTEIVIFFDEPLAQDATQLKVEALLTDEASEGLTIVVPAQSINPYSYTFVAPEHREGMTNIRLLVNGKPVGSKPLKFISNAEKYNALTQVYLHQLGKLCSLLTKNRVPISDVDNCLSSLFDLDSSTDVPDIPVEAFELLFGNYRHVASEDSEVELPTLLHFAAKHGLKELASKLTDLPDATLAHAIRNCNKKKPEDLARINKHSSLTTFLENFREVNEGIEDLYVKCHGYVNVDGPANEDIDGYLKAKNRLVGLNSAPDYIALESYDFGVEDEGDDDIYYMYVPTQSKSATTTTTTGDRKTLEQPSNAASSTTKPVASIVATVSVSSKVPTLAGNQQHLVEIMDLFKNKKCSMAEVETLFKQWKRQYQDASSSKSFRDKQESLRKMKEDVAKARKQGEVPISVQSKLLPRKDGPAPVLPSKGK